MSLVEALPAYESRRVILPAPLGVVTGLDVALAVVCLGFLALAVVPPLRVGAGEVSALEEEGAAEEEGFGVICFLGARLVSVVREAAEVLSAVRLLVMAEVDAIGEELNRVNLERTARGV